MATSNIGFQSFYQSQLTSAISDTDLTIPLDTLPTPSEGYLVIESTVSAKREIIYYTSKTGTAVVVPSGAGNGRGFDGTTAVSHTQGATVIMAPIGAMFGNQAIKDMLGVTTDVTGGWDLLASGTPSTVTALGNRSYTVLIPSADTTSATSVGMRLKLPRTVTAPTQCTSLNGTTQYYNKTSPAGMTFTTTFTCSAWIKLSSYADAIIISRYNGTSGWGLKLTSSGQLRIQGLGAGVNRTYDTYQSVPLNKWIHVAMSLDMSGTAVAYFDGVVVPHIATSAIGAALTQAGNLEVGSWNGGTSPFPGKIAQVAVYSAVISAATIKAAANQTLTGSETSLVSAYSFNGVITDLNTTNANNLTAQGSAVATDTDTPFTNPVTGTSVTAGTTNYGIIMAQTFSTNTTYTIQIPEGETLPTTGGIGALSYSTQKTPYGFPAETNKWILRTFLGNFTAVSIGSTGTWYISPFNLNVPIGKWILKIQANAAVTSTVAGIREGNWILSSAAELPSLAATTFNDSLICHFYVPSGNYAMVKYIGYKEIDLTAATAYSMYGSVQSSTGAESWYVNKTNEITAECAYL